jgi:hypothetical protein
MYKNDFHTLYAVQIVRLDVSFSEDVTVEDAIAAIQEETLIDYEISDEEVAETRFVTDVFEEAEDYLDGRL